MTVQELLAEWDTMTQQFVGDATRAPKRDWVARTADELGPELLEVWWAAVTAAAFEDSAAAMDLGKLVRLVGAVQREYGTSTMPAQQDKGTAAEDLRALMRARFSGQVGQREYVVRFNEFVPRLQCQPVDGTFGDRLPIHPRNLSEVVDLMPEEWFAWWRERGVEPDDFAGPALQVDTVTGGVG